MRKRVAADIAHGIVGHAVVHHILQPLRACGERHAHADGGENGGKTRKIDLPPAHDAVGGAADQYGHIQRQRNRNQRQQQ